MNSVSFANSEKLIHALELLGLTTQEILLLTNLLSSSTSLSTVDLERLTSLPKHQIYRALKKLINEAFIEEVSNTIPKKYYTSPGTIKNYTRSQNEKAELEKNLLMKSSSSELTQIWMDSEEQEVFNLLLRNELSRNDLKKQLGYSYEKIRNITAKLETKHYIEGYKIGKIIRYRSIPLSKILDEQMKDINKQMDIKKELLSEILTYTTDIEESVDHSVSETKINDYFPIFEEDDKFRQNEPIYSTLFIGIDSSKIWKDLLIKELSTAFKLKNKGYYVYWLVSEEIISLLVDFDLDDMLSLIKSCPNFCIRIYSKIIERIVIINSSEFFHFSFTPSFLDSVIYHKDNHITELKIKEFQQAWEESSKINPFIYEVIDREELSDFIDDKINLQTFKSDVFCFMGDRGVGKSSLIHRYLTGKFISNIRVTLGIKVDKAMISLPQRLFQGNDNIRILIYDFGGQETFHNSYISQIKDKNAFGVVFALDSLESFNNLEYWLQFIHKNCNPTKNPLIILIGTKADIENLSIGQDLIWDLRKKYRIEHYFKTSALKGTNVRKLFETIAELLEKR